MSREIGGMKQTADRGHFQLSGASIDPRLLLLQSLLDSRSHGG